MPNDREPQSSMICPHKDVRFCPLYVVAHDPNLCGLSCDDGKLDWQECAVARGMDYAKALGKVEAAAPQLVAELQWQEMVERFGGQRLRNMRLAGVH